MSRQLCAVGRGLTWLAVVVFSLASLVGSTASSTSLAPVTLLATMRLAAATRAAVDTSSSFFLDTVSLFTGISSIGAPFFSAFFSAELVVVVVVVVFWHFGSLSAEALSFVGVVVAAEAPADLGLVGDLDTLAPVLLEVGVLVLDDTAAFGPPLVVAVLLLWSTLAFFVSATATATGVEDASRATGFDDAAAGEVTEGLSLFEARSVFKLSATEGLFVALVLLLE